MMNPRNILSTFATLLFLLAVSSHTYAGPLEGVWTNTAPETRSVSKIEITKADKGYELVLWSVVGGKPERRAPIELELLGDSVHNPNPTKYGYAQWDLDFATKHYILRRKGNELELEILTIFKPISERPGPPMADSRVNFRRSEMFQSQ